MEVGLGGMDGITHRNEPVVALIVEIDRRRTAQPPTVTDQTTPPFPLNPKTQKVVDVLVIIPFIFHAFFRGFVQLRLLRVTRVLRVR